ncbi:MAG: hypothetical protein JO202_06010 [Ktedonobacteraceae bacterium]|nr:hypothetical protein [Ktedonobacteraceae bacterium]
MEAEEIIARAKAQLEAPHGWVVLPLLPDKLAWDIASWIFGIFVGFGLLAFIVPIVIPHNYQHGLVAALFTTLLLAIMLFIGIGSLWALIVDVRRLLQADKYLIVITSDDFVKQQGEKIIHVPLANVRYVTARGKRPPDRTPPQESAAQQVAGTSKNTAGFFLGRGLVSGPRPLSRRMRTPTSLAFIDTRTETEVIVVNDTSHGDPFMIAALLKQYTSAIHK